MLLLLGHFVLHELIWLLVKLMATVNNAVEVPSAVSSVMILSIVITTTIIISVSSISVVPVHMPNFAFCVIAAGRYASVSL